MNKVIFKSEDKKIKIIDFYNKILRRWPVSYEEINVKTKYGDTNVLSCGQKNNPPLVLIHGSTSNSAMWIGDIENYVKYFRVYMIDIPGEPGKSQAVRFDLETCEPAEWLDQIIVDLKIKKFYLCGISLGGLISLNYTIRNVNKVEKLVLLCPGGIGKQKMKWIPYLLSMSFLGWYGAKKSIEKVCWGEEVHDEAIYYHQIITKGFNPRIDKFPVFSDEQLNKLRMKTFIIFGKMDIFFDSEETIKRAKSTIPNLKYEILEDKGHGLINKSTQIVDFLIEEA
ncbi:MAG: alpha/beta hydrolase [Clostridiales bacterium]